MENSDHLLKVALAAAVPLWIMELQKKPLSYLMERKGICAQTIGEKGDIILYKSKRPGRTAEAFNHLAEGMAILAILAKGGVEMFGLKFDAKHPEIEEEVPTV